MEEAALKPGAPPRALALDALRGLAIMGMCLSGIVPWRGLPNWMYHAQFPRMMNGRPVENIAFNPNWPGYSWVDLVFPTFLFAMGAAFPFALSSRIRRQWPWRRIIGSVFLRGALLVVFAIYVQHISPWAISSSPTTTTFLLSMLAFALLFPIYTRLPKGWHPALRWGIRIAGVAGAVAYLASLPFADGTGFSKARSDIIILILANVAVLGSLIWIVSRRSIAARIAILAGCYFINLAKYSEFGFLEIFRKVPDGWGWFYLPPWGFMMTVIPGTIVGDLLLRWMRERREGDAPPAWDNYRLLAISFLSLLVVIIVHTGLQAREGMYTLLAIVCIFALVVPMVWDGRSASEKLLKQFFLWGSLWLGIGVLLDSGLFDFVSKGWSFRLSEGGIKKDPATSSYFLVSAGLAIYLLVSLTVWIDMLGKAKWFTLLIAPGQNPMIAYAGIRGFLAPLVMVTGIDSLVYEKVLIGPWPGMLWALAKTAFLAVIVTIFTKLKITWRT